MDEQTEREALRVEVWCDLAPVGDFTHRVVMHNGRDSSLSSPRYTEEAAQFVAERWRAALRSSVQPPQGDEQEYFIVAESVSGLVRHVHLSTSPDFADQPREVATLIRGAARVQPQGDEARVDSVPAGDRWVCDNGHAGRMFLKSEHYGGDMCLTCHSPVRLYTLAFAASRQSAPEPATGEIECPACDAVIAIDRLSDGSLSASTCVPIRPATGGEREPDAFITPRSAELLAIDGHATIFARRIADADLPVYIGSHPVATPAGDSVADQIRAIVKTHFDDVRYYSDSYHLKDRWASMALDKISQLLAPSQSEAPAAPTTCPAHLQPMPCKWCAEFVAPAAPTSEEA